MKILLRLIIVIIAIVIAIMSMSFENKPLDGSTDKKTEESAKKSTSKKNSRKQHQAYLRSLTKYGKKQNKAFKKRASDFKVDEKKSGVTGVDGCTRDASGNPVKRTKSYK